MKRWLLNIFAPGEPVKDSEHLEHNWGSWAPYGSGLYFQRRTCQTCGFVQEKNIGG